jgi:hypothetical protein
MRFSRAVLILVVAAPSPIGKETAAHLNAPAFLPCSYGVPAYQWRTYAHLSLCDNKR